MRLLLDTHIFLWWVKDDKRLSEVASSKIISADDVYVSSASIWEIAIKTHLGKVSVDMNKLVESIHDSHFLELSITSQHAALVSELPDIHKDPFDRLLLAQAISEPLTFLTVDAKLKKYSELVELVK